MKRFSRARWRGIAVGVAGAVLVAGVGLTVVEVRADRASADARTTADARATAMDVRAGTAAAVRAADRAEADLLAAERREHARTAEVAARTAAAAAVAAQAQADADARATAATAAAAKAAAGKAAPAPRPAPSAPAAPGVPVWVTSIPTADGDGSNGHMPASAMCLIGWGTDQIGSPQYLRCDAADALTRLNDAFRAHFGESLAMDLTYRSYEEQVAIRAYYGGLAAKPGTSSHGLGLALDVQEWPDVYGFATPRYTWLVANAPTFGWTAPASVRETATYPEYWHFEYTP